MQRWEYFIAETLNYFELNRFGEEGWELIAVTCRDDGAPIVFYFKRPKRGD